MNQELYNDTLKIINHSIHEVLPELAVKKILSSFNKPSGKTIMISIGKAAFSMAKATLSLVHIDDGLVITKYNHSKGNLNNTTIIEAGHPLLDENSIKGANKAIELCSNLTKDDVVLMLISGGGSSLFEAPVIDIEQLQNINDQLLKSGASINEINTIRKRLSKVKGGKFAELCKPAKVVNIILSDIINDPLDMIASGPTYPDNSSSYDALNIIKKYNITTNNEIIKYLRCEPIKKLNNIETFVVGNNNQLKLSAKVKAEELGYKTIYIDNALISNVEETVKFLKNYIDEYSESKENICIIAGGEITVAVNGNGLGGRNMELTCAMAKFIKENMCFFAVGSDGTDGPTDSAGGYIDIDLYHDEIKEYLKNNDSYHYLEKYGGLIKTGPTGTNVCDLYCLLIKKKEN